MQLRTAILPKVLFKIVALHVKTKPSMAKYSKQVMEATGL